MTLETTLESDIGTYDVDDVSRFSLWEATGHIEYHVTHRKFLGSRLIRQQHYGTYDVNGVGRLSSWDATGQIEYHVTQ